MSKVTSTNRHNPVQTYRLLTCRASLRSGTCHPRGCRCGRHVTSVDCRSGRPHRAATASRRASRRDATVDSQKTLRRREQTAIPAGRWSIRRLQRDRSIRSCSLSVRPLPLVSSSRSCADCTANWGPCKTHPREAIQRATLIYRVGHDSRSGFRTGGRRERRPLPGREIAVPVRCVGSKAGERPRIEA